MIFAVAYLAFAIFNAFRLRHRAAFFQRLNDVHWQALVMLDVVAAWVIFGGLYLFGALHERPIAGETISRRCGREMLAGKIWAEKAAAGIDALFFIFTSQRNHCINEALNM